MRQNNSSTQAGNVFILILAGVFLFGALALTFTRSAQKGSGNLSKQQAKIAAQEILNYARLVEGAVDRVRRNGCSENEISFENAVVAGYSNPNALPDKSCHIFDTAGGKISYKNPNTEWLDTNFNTEENFGTFIFTGRTCVKDVGMKGANCHTDVDLKEELVFFSPFIKKEICTAINQLIALPSLNPEQESASAWQPLSSGLKFIGTYANGNQLSTSGSIYEGKSNYCFEGNVSPPSGSYNFYQVLLAR
jgi:hypothetical protein